MKTDARAYAAIFFLFLDLLHFTCKGGTKKNKGKKPVLRFSIEY